METAILENKTEQSTSELSFQVEKEVLLNGLRIVERATAQKGNQQVLSNILLDAVDKNKINLYATDFDLTMITSIEANVESLGKITLPARKLLDIVSRLNETIIDFRLNGTMMSITSGKSKFDIIGISASEFPKIELLTEEDNEVEIDLKPFVVGIKEAGFAAQSYESNNNILSGVVCDINKNVLEIVSTDGNRLARARKIINNKDDKAVKLIVPAKVLQEFLKVSYFIEEDTVKLYTKTNKIMIKSENITMISNLMNGQYPQYNQLIPQTFPKEAKISVAKLISALELVSTMINEKTNIAKFNFTQNNLSISGDTPETGKSQSDIDILYSGEDILIAFNYRFLLEFLKNIDAEDVIICMNTNLSATVLKPDNEEDFIYLVMPVQVR